MASPMLLEPRIVDGRLVFVFSDTRTLSLTGGSTPYASFNQELMARVGLYEDGAVAEDVDVNQVYRVDPEAKKLEVVAQINLEESELLEEFPVGEFPRPEAPALRAD